MEQQKKVRIREEPLTDTRISSIAHGDTKDTAQITVVNHIMKQETIKKKQVHNKNKTRAGE